MPACPPERLIASMPASCRAITIRALVTVSPIDVAFPGSVKLKKNNRGKFALNASQPGLSLSISGNFVNRFRTAYGEFHLAGSFLVDGTSGTCDTGPRDWEAQRTSYAGSR